jgi:hypothetical protein
MQLLIDDALAAWDNAPLHIRVMAGAYVGPLLAALVAIGERIEKLEEAQNAGK